MKTQKISFGVSRTGRPRKDFIDHKITINRDDCDGHETTFTYDYTGLETAHKFPWTHSDKVESWRVNAAPSKGLKPYLSCKLIEANTSGNHAEFKCKIDSKLPQCAPGTIEHFGGWTFRLLLYATMKQASLPEPTTPKERKVIRYSRSNPEKNLTKFVGTKKSKVYHETECWRVKRIKDKNLIEITEAEKNARRQCKSCD